MGYCITDKKPGESLDITSSAVYFVTDEEYAIAKKVFAQECESAIRKMKEALPEDLAKTVYFNHVAQYAHTVLGWLNKTSWYANPGACPCDTEDAVRREFTYADIMLDIENCLAGKGLSFVYFYYKISDDAAIKYQNRLSKNPILGKRAKISNDMIPIGSVAYLLIDFKDILPVRITNRKGFLYYCESLEDGNSYTVPCNRLFQTEEAAQNKIKERND